MSDKNVGYIEKEGLRLIYDSKNNLVQIRNFRPNAKIGDPVNAYDLIYDNFYNCINMLYVQPSPSVNNLDIRVPERPSISSITQISIDGVCSGQIVKDGDIVIAISDNDKKEVGRGIISGGLFSFSIDLSRFNLGTEVVVYVTVQNDRASYHGTSEQSIRKSVTIS